MTKVDFDANWDFNDPAGTEQTFRKILAEAGEAAPRAWRAELLTQIARTLGLQRKFEEADALLDDAKPLAEGNARAMARWHLERGRVRNSSGRKPEAMPLFEKAWELAEEAKSDYYAVDALHMLAIAAPPEAQMDWHRRAIDRAKASAEERARNWRGSLLNNLGWTLHSAGEYEEALSAFREALEAREEQAKAGPIRIAKWCVARCLRSLGRVSEALAIQEALLAEHVAAGSSDGFVEEELAECLLALGQEETAKPHFANAFLALKDDPWLKDSEPDRIERLGRLGGKLKTS